MAGRKKTNARQIPRQRRIVIPKDDEGVGMFAWAVGSKTLRWFAGLMTAIAAIAIAWDQLGWPKPASRSYVHEVITPLDAGIKSLTVGNLQNRIETLSSRRAAAHQVKAEKLLQLRASKSGELTRLLQEQIDGLDQTGKDLDKQIEDLQEQVRRKGN